MIQADLKKEDREKIESDVQKFLKKGGKIKSLDHAAKTETVYKYNYKVIKGGLNEGR